ncbi:NADPH--cytochrome P450 reductase [Fusarium falciforme]|uniref:NADPH--cytochrome P450 reductase n=1 Tax=Fusarium falciforme TaxID=195108 RepID=UPI002301E369|nr:NADPH--cytochrome P450 reductase [Fusarium falciforme]WAO96803.1 NADPH--cytochrome P450 reductase [Fusarium falciforme]
MDFQTLNHTLQESVSSIRLIYNTALLEPLSTIVSFLILISTASYLTGWKPWARSNKHDADILLTVDEENARDIITTMEKTGKNCVVFYGSQSGNAEDYATRLAQEGKSCYGLETMVADLEDYDYDNLDMFPRDSVAIFVLATYGEGEPTDNAVDFYRCITDATFSDDRSPPLGNLRYIIFGLGNSTYEHYNLMGRNVNKMLESLGAQRIGQAGEGDDGSGTLEDAFLTWKDGMWTALANHMGLHQRKAVYEPVFKIAKEPGLATASPEVYTGEPNDMHLKGVIKGPFNAQNPYIAPVTKSMELLSGTNRNCLHLEIDIRGSGLAYQTGDHIAVWPMNATHEVDEFLHVVGLEEQNDAVIRIEPIDSTTKVPFPTPITFDAIVRYRLEICAPVSRQFLSRLVTFAPNKAAETEISKLAQDKAYFHEKVGKMQYNLSRMLNIASGGEKWTKIPFSLLIEGLPKLQPRYYSISSSSLVQPDTISITAVVENQVIPGRADPFKGVATNYLLALKHHQDGDAKAGSLYELMGPKRRYGGVCLPIHVRSSNFRLPCDPSKPVILIGPGTGIAPMRAFIHERARLAALGQPVGRTLLFFGCRRRSEDYLYESEWEDLKKIPKFDFEVATAFSREGPTKVYVQHRLKERASEVNRLLEEDASVYVCGDAANMAIAVKEVLVQVVSGQRQVPKATAENILKAMKASRRYQEDVW